MTLMTDNSAIAQLKTYHCACTQLLLATAHDLKTLPRRSSPAIDKAIILPRSSSTDGDDTSSGWAKADSADSTEARYGYSVWTSVESDRLPILIRREDGFEKRFLLRCGRCRLIVGYKLEQTQYEASADSARRNKAPIDIVYILPGALVGTEEMQRGEIAQQAEWEVEAT